MATSGNIQEPFTSQELRLSVSPEDHQSPQEQSLLDKSVDGSVDELESSHTILSVSPEDHQLPLEQSLLDKSVDDSVDELESGHTILSVPPKDQRVDQRLPEEEGLLEEVYELESKHTIFLSHSGAQKNFVEQLCVDLEHARLNPFFDKRPESLPKGEGFARHIFRAAEQIELAIVVVSEEYFTRSKWPMLELCTFVQSSNCKIILPLFFGLEFHEFRNRERRERWFEKWHAWAQDDARIRVEDWKKALKELDRRNGLRYVEALGEVDFRRDVVRTVSDITKKALQRLVIAEISRKAWSKIIYRVILIIVVGILLYVVWSYLMMLIMFKIDVPLAVGQLNTIMDGQMERFLKDSERFGGLLDTKFP